MPEAVLRLPGTLKGVRAIRAQVEDDPDEAAFEDEDLEDDDWDDLDEPEELEFDENGDNWDDEFDEDFEDYVSDKGSDEEEW